MYQKILVIILFTLFLQACCDKPAPCCESTVQMKFNYNFNKKDSNAFVLNDRFEFYIVKTNINTYAPIDSTQAYLWGVNDSTLQMVIYEDLVGSYSNCNFIISNHKINYADTISQISFNVSSYTESCSNCGSLRKKKINCTQLDNLNFMFNKTHVLASDPPILISKK
jgi:hypothetical protein